MNQPTDFQNSDTVPSISLDVAGEGPAVIAKLINFLRDENLKLRSGNLNDLTASNERKSRLLLQLMRASKAANDGEKQIMQQQAQQLQDIIEENKECIAVQQRAIREISDLMTGVLKNEDADGTYADRF